MDPSEGGRPETYRLFIAIPVPEHVKDQIEGAQDELRGALSRDRVRWSKRAQFHLTLKFLGNLEPQRLDALTHALRLACAGFGVLRLRAGGIGAFPELRRPRVIWVRVRDARERLPLLQRAVETAVAGFTSEQLDATFHGHITLGRCTTIKRARIDRLARLAKAMEEDKDKRPFGEWTAETIDLVRSERGPGGSRYTILATVPLGAIGGASGEDRGTKNGPQDQERTREPGTKH